MSILLEICVDDALGLDAAIAGGADRIELCSALELGGLSPTPGLIALAKASPVPVYAMVRPRAGDFAFDDGDVSAMLAEIDAVREAGLAGVVLGASHADGALDHATLSRLARHAEGLGTTLHRAFDLAPDFAEALDIAIALGFERILTSGGAVTAPEGIDTLAGLFARAAGRIAIMPGSGVKAETAGALRAALPLTQVHASCAVPGPAPHPRAITLGFCPGPRRQTSVAAVQALKAALA